MAWMNGIVRYGWIDYVKRVRVGTGIRFAAGKRQNQDFRDFMIWQDCEIPIAEWFRILIVPEFQKIMTGLSYLNLSSRAQSGNPVTQEVNLQASRLPRRFAPLNDKSGRREHGRRLIGGSGQLRGRAVGEGKRVGGAAPEAIYGVAGMGRVFGESQEGPQLTDVFHRREGRRGPGPVVEALDDVPRAGWAAESVDGAFDVRRPGDALGGAGAPRQDDAAWARGNRASKR